MPQDVSGFIVPAQHFEGLYQLDNQLAKRRYQQQMDAERQERLRNTAATFLGNYLDKKDYLSGTDYDPVIVQELQRAMSQGARLASQGAGAPELMMALGPTVAKINEYSTKAKLINQQIKDSVSKLKQYKGYNSDALSDLAKQKAFYDLDANGRVTGLKDISAVDPSTDFVTSVIRDHPDKVTSSAALDEYVNKTPMSDYSRTINTAYAGRSRQVKYEAQHPYYMGLAEDNHGKLLLDAAGNPKGLDVLSSVVHDGQNSYRVMDKQAFRNVMEHNPDVADYVRGDVMRYFNETKQPDQKMPLEGSPEWDLMARHVLYDELKSRDKSHFKVADLHKETSPAIKVEIGQNPQMLDNLAKYEEAVKLKGDYSTAPTKVTAPEALAKIFTHDKDYVGGDLQNYNGQKVLDVTHLFGKGSLQYDKGGKHVFSKLVYNPESRTMTAEWEQPTVGKFGKKTTETMSREIPEKDLGKFMVEIARSNNTPVEKVASILEQYGYKDGKFENVHASDLQQRLDLEKRRQENIKRNGFFGQFNSLFGNK